MKKWYIYKNGIKEGQADRISEVFIRIEGMAGQPLTNWEVTPDLVKVKIAEDTYEAKKEYVQ